MARLPVWDLIHPGREARLALRAADDELERLMGELLGPAGSPAVLLDATERRLRFGTLDDTRVTALLRLQRDQQEELDTLRRNHTGIEGYVAGERIAAGLEREHAAALAKLLTPQEQADYAARNSRPAQEVMTALRLVEATEEQYRALVAAQQEFDPAAHNRMLIFTTDDPSSRLAALSAHAERLKATLGPELAHDYLRVTDYRYTQTVRFTERFPDLPRDTTDRLSLLAAEAQVAMNRSLEAYNQAATADTVAIQAALQGKLETMLGPQRAAAFRAGEAGLAFRVLADQAAKAGKK